MHSLSTIATALAFLGVVVSGLPANTGPSKAANAPSSCESPPAAPPAQPGCTPGRVVAPGLITLTDADPSLAVSQPSGRDLSLSLGPEGTNQEQIALFEGIPATAKDCTFGWKQRKENIQDTFDTDGNALVEYRPLPVDGGPYSFSQVADFAGQNPSPSMIDFTSWDQAGFAVDQFHVGGIISCAERIHMHLRVSALNGDMGGVRMQGVSAAGSNSQLQGVFVEWKC